MKPFVLLSVLGLALVMPEVSQAANSNPATAATNGLAVKPPMVTGPHSPIPKGGWLTVYGYCVYCYTCGGNFQHQLTLADSRRFTSATGVYERGSSCTGPIRFINDSQPYVCCKYKSTINP